MHTMTATTAPTPAPLDTLTAEQRRAAARDGYLVVEDVLTPEECRMYAARLEEYGTGRRPVPAGMTVQREPRVERGEVVAAAGSDIRKIIRIAETDELFQGLARHPALVRILQGLLGPNLKVKESAVFMKPAGVGSAKGYHQDSQGWPIEPPALWTCWVPFDPSTLDNGCMVYVRGSHTRGILPVKLVVGEYAENVVSEDEYDHSEVTPVPMRAGSAVFHHSLTVHGTAANRSLVPRRAFAMHVMAAEFRYTGSPPMPQHLRISGVDVPGGV
jgi:phytanoyl-CoA hydroxylase